MAATKKKRSSSVRHSKHNSTKKSSTSKKKSSHKKTTSAKSTKSKASKTVKAKKGLKEKPSLKAKTQIDVEERSKQKTTNKPKTQFETGEAFFKSLRKRFSDLYNSLEFSDVYTERISSGIDGLDDLLAGGFHKNSVIIFAGPPGSGKTLFGLEFVYEGVLSNEPVLFISLTESMDSIHKHLEPILQKYKGEKDIEKNFHLAYYSPYELREMLTGTRNSLLDYIDEHNISRLVIDPISALTATFKSASDENEFVYKMFQLFQKADATVLLTVDRETPKTERFTRWDFMADTLIELNFEEVGLNEKFRFLDVVKARDTDIKLRKAPYILTPTGVHVFSEEGGLFEL